MPPCLVSNNAISLILDSMRAGSNGAFQKLERGEIDLWTFYDAFSEQLSDPLNIAAYAKYAQLRGKGKAGSDSRTKHTVHAPPFEKRY